MEAGGVWMASSCEALPAQFYVRSQRVQPAPGIQQFQRQRHNRRANQTSCKASVKKQIQRPERNGNQQSQKGTDQRHHRPQQCAVPVDFIKIGLSAAGQKTRQGNPDERFPCG